MGAYASYFLDGATGGVIVCLQTLIFLLAFLFAPKHGMLAARSRAREALEPIPFASPAEPHGLPEERPA